MATARYLDKLTLRRLKDVLDRLGRAYGEAVRQKTLRAGMISIDEAAELEQWYARGFEWLKQFMADGAEYVVDEPSEGQ